ncbi:MAG: transposase [Leptospiraceae bacterium]|nr:transposase [Leptospiraceae bacterium]
MEGALTNLALDNHILKKAKISARLEAKEIIRKHLAPEFGIVKSYKALEISISSFYYQSDTKIKRKQEDKQLIEKIEAYLDLMPQSGYRSVTYFLRNDMKINHKRVYRIMHENLLNAVRRGLIIMPTTDSKHNLKKYPNLLKDKSINHARSNSW